jgi:hypothetical protein
MADIEFRPDQQVPAGRYYVILRRVQEMSNEPNVEMNLGEAEVNGAANGNMQMPANPPMQNIPEENIVNNMQGGKKSRGTKKMKKSKGTRKLSGYMKFAQEVRPRILQENPNLKSDIPGMGRKIGQMWRNLSSAEKARY